MNANATEHIDRPVQMAAKEISTIMAFGGFGALFSVLPVVQLLHHVGPRLVFGVLLVASGIATVLMSPLAQLDVYWMLPARFVQGIALSSVMPLLGSVSAEWAALGDVGKFVTLLSANGQLAQILTMPLSAQLCVTSGWSSVYTVHGLLSVVAGIVFVAVYRNQAHTHPCISRNELMVIDKVKNTPARTVHKVPYRQIASSKPVWAVWIAFIGNAVSFQLVVQFMPTFLNKVVKLGVRRTGIYAVIPPLMQLIVKLIAGWASDRLCLPEAIKLRIFNSLAQIGCAICLLPLGFIHEGQGTLAIVCFTASISFLGLVSCGSMKSATLVARSFTHFVMAVVQLIICISMLVVPYIVAAMAPDNTIEQWRYVFLLVSIVLALSNYVFCVLCSAEAQPWATVPVKNVS
uniref:MFS domain-containing protein n=1 Tax=Panagrellus redivivus TaxID=6233 RepID=A0A7E4VF49_PANRE